MPSPKFMSVSNAWKSKVFVIDHPPLNWQPYCVNCEQGRIHFTCMRSSSKKMFLNSHVDQFSDENDMPTSEKDDGPTVSLNQDGSTMSLADSNAYGVSFSDSRTVSSDGSEKQSQRSLHTSRPSDEELDFDTLKEFEEILSADSQIDLESLRELSKSGVPSHVRGQVWKYLLGVMKPDRSEEISMDIKLSEDYREFNKRNDEIIKRAKGEVKRCRPEVSRFRESGVRSSFERIICAFLSNHPHLEYAPNMVHMLGPFLFCTDNERDAYYCFESLMKMHEHMFRGSGTSRVLSTFMTLLRNLLPSLHETFEEEEVDPSTWASSWLQSLLCRALPLPCLLRLWDTYFSCEEGLDLHPYVCLAILESSTEQLSEMDSTDLQAFIQRLPVLDMESVISNAYNMREKVIARNIV